MAFSENLKTGQAYRVLTGTDAITGQNIYDRLSFWTSAQDVVFDNDKMYGTTLDDISNTFFYASGVLQPNQTSVTITSELITNDGLIDIYVPDEFCKVTPNSITRGTNTVTITFPAQQTAMEVRVVCKNYQRLNGGT